MLASRRMTWRCCDSLAWLQRVILSPRVSGKYFVLPQMFPTLTNSRTTKSMAGFGSSCSTFPVHSLNTASRNPSMVSLVDINVAFGSVAAPQACSISKHLFNSSSSRWSAVAMVRGPRIRGLPSWRAAKSRSRERFVERGAGEGLRLLTSIDPPGVLGCSLLMGRPDEGGWWSMVVMEKSEGDARVEAREHACFSTRRGR